MPIFSISSITFNIMASSFNFGVSLKSSIALGSNFGRFKSIVFETLPKNVSCLIFSSIKVFLIESTWPGLYE